MKKSVLFVIDVLKYGGAQKVMLHYAGFLARHGIKVSFFAIKDDRDIEVPKKFKIYSAIGKDQKITENIFYVLERLSRAVKEHDVVIGFMDFITNYITLLCSMIQGKPAYLYVANTLSEEIEKFDHKQINRDLVTFTYERAGALICPARAVRKDIITNFGISGKNIQVIYNPVDTRGIKRLKKEAIGPAYEKTFEGRTVISVGRLEKQKNHEKLIYAFGGLTSRFGEEIKLVIIGEGSLKEKLARTIEKLELKKQVFLIGEQSNIYKFLCRSDLFVLPSVYEGMPLVLLDAMAAGVPIAVSRFGSASEIITDRKNGLLFNADDTRDISAKMQSLLDDRRMAERLRNRASEDVMKFDIDTIGPEMLDLLKLEKPGKK